MVRFIFDLKGFLIGVLVVCFALFLSYNSIRKWYENDSAPKEVINSVQRFIGSASASSSNLSGPSISVTEKSQTHREIVQKSVQENDVSSGNKSEISTEQAAHELLKQANQVNE